MAISQITSNSIAAGAVSASDLADGSISADKLANSAVTTAKIATANVTTATIADANVTSAKLATEVIPLGVNQTWQDVSGSRSLGVTYTNSTGRPIFFMVSVGQNNSGIGVNGSIGGIAINTHQDNGSASTGSFFGVVPNGGTYGPISVETGKTMNTWLELR